MNYVYLHDAENLVAVIAYAKEHVPEGSDSQFRYGLAIVSKNDKATKKQGKSIASSRFQNIHKGRAFKDYNGKASTPKQNRACMIFQEYRFCMMGSKTVDDFWKEVDIIRPLLKQKVTYV